MKLADNVGLTDDQYLELRKEVPEFCLSTVGRSKMQTERQRQDAELCEKLGVQTISVGKGDDEVIGCSVDLEKAVHFALDFAKNEGIKVCSKLSLKLMADGREVGGTSSVLWGMQIMNIQVYHPNLPLLERAHEGL